MKKQNISVLFLIAVLAFSNVGAVRTPEINFPPGFDAEWFANLGELIFRGEVIIDQLVIKVQPGMTIDYIKNCAGISGASSISTNATLGFQTLDLHNFPLLKAIKAIVTCPGVIYVEPNYIHTITDTIPNDTYFVSDQYGLENIRAPQGWDISTGSTTITIAILDSGVDLDHPDLVSKIVPGYDFVNNDSIPQDDNGHGTHVAGIAAAVSNNGLGVAGVSWGARIMPVKVLDETGTGSSSDIAEAIIWAADQGVDVINMSFGSPSASTTIRNAVNYAYSKGVTLVAALGNDGRELPYEECGIFGCTEYSFYPAAFDHVIAVGATDSTNTKAGFSNYGTPLEVMAPGVNILSTYFEPSDPDVNHYAWMGGTSMASPFVAGLAAIMAGLPGVSSPDEIAQALKTSTLDLGTPGWDGFYGYGLVQMDGAIGEIQPPAIPGDFGKVNPTQSEINVMTNPGISWGISSDAVSYDYCVDQIDDDLCEGSWISTGIETTADIQINSNSTYFWQVRSNNFPEMTVADAGQWWSFTSVSCSTLELTSSPEVGGTVELDPLPNCQDGSKYINGTEVTVTAVPASNYYRFIGWGGDLGGTTPPNSVTMSSDRSVSANFEISTFGDVPFDHPHWAYIQALYDNGLTAGCSAEPLLYCPEANLTRAEAAVFMLRGRLGTSYDPPTASEGFVFDNDDWSSSAVSWGRIWAEGLWDEGMTAGCSSDPLLFCPRTAHQISRAEAEGIRSTTRQ